MPPLSLSISLLPFKTLSFPLSFFTSTDHSSISPTTLRLVDQLSVLHISVSVSDLWHAWSHPISYKGYSSMPSTKWPDSGQQNVCCSPGDPSDFFWLCSSLGIRSTKLGRFRLALTFPCATLFPVNFAVAEMFCFANFFNFLRLEDSVWFGWDW